MGRVASQQNNSQSEHCFEQGAIDNFTFYIYILYKQRCEVERIITMIIMYICVCIPYYFIINEGEVGSSFCGKFNNIFIGVTKHHGSLSSYLFICILYKVEKEILMDTGETYVPSSSKMIIILVDILGKKSFRNDGKLVERSWKLHFLGSLNSLFVSLRKMLVIWVKCKGVLYRMVLPNSVYAQPRSYIFFSTT